MSTFIWQHKLEIASILVFLALAGVSIWDALLIIKDYQEENTYTLVNFSEIKENEPKPFFENQSIGICLCYGHSTIFPDVWINRSIYGEPMSTEEAIKNIEQLQQKFAIGTIEGNFGYENLTFTDSQSLLTVLGSNMLKYLDDRKFGCIFSGEAGHPMCNDYELRINNSAESLLLMNLSILTQLEDMIWTGMKKNFILGDGILSDDIISLDYWDLEANNVCIDIDLHPLRFRSSIYSNDPSYKLTNILNMPDFQKMLDTQDANGLEFSIDTKMPNDRKNTVNVGASTVMALTVAINNIGMLNRSITQQPCKDEPKFTIPVTDYVDQCGFGNYLRATVEKCGCVPISYRRQWQKLEPQSSTEPIKYCTPVMYAECQDLVTKDMIKSPCDPACTVVKNQYTLSNRTLDSWEPGWNYDSDTCYRAILNIICDDRSYVYFEEKFQLSPTQLLSQVGGDIGLYTGISMLSIWQLFIFICNLYGSYSRMRQEEKAEAAARRATVGQYFNRIIGLASAKNQDDSTELMKLKVDQLGKDMEKILQVLEKLDVKDMSFNSGRRGFGNKIAVKPGPDQHENMQMHDL